MPEVTNELMKRFWKIRKVMSSGAITMSVPAAMVPQAWVPSAVAVNTESPTVSGRLAGELITISGYRKSFQWLVTEMMAKAEKLGIDSGT